MEASNCALSYVKSRTVYLKGIPKPPNSNERAHLLEYAFGGHSCLWRVWWGTFVEATKSVQLRKCRGECEHLVGWLECSSLFGIWTVVYGGQLNYHW